MTTESRMTHVETEVKNLNVCISVLTDIAARQQTLLEEIKQDTSMTRRLWVHLAQKNGWMEDGDWPPPA